MGDNNRKYDGDVYTVASSEDVFLGMFMRYGFFQNKRKISIVVICGCGIRYRFGPRINIRVIISLHLK